MNAGNSRFSLRTALVLAAAAVTLFQSCGSPPEPFPLPEEGSLRVSAASSVPIDSIEVRLNDLSRGIFANPCTLRAVVAGTHKLTVIDSAGARVDTMVAVRRDQISAAVVRLTRIGPFVGNEAPNFSVQDIDGRGFDLSAQRGRVVFVSFFEYTWASCITTEFPSFQYGIFTRQDTTRFRMIAFETISSTAWLKSYRPTKGITYPMAFDSTRQVSALYRVGAAYGNVVPTLLLVDKKGVVRFRTDGLFNQIVPLSDKITELLAEP